MKTEPFLQDDGKVTALLAAQIAYIRAAEDSPAERSAKRRRDRALRGMTRAERDYAAVMCGSIGRLCSR